MSSSNAFLISHVVFATKGRTDWLAKEIREELYHFMGATTKSMGGELIAAGGVEDHAHLLPLLPPSLCLSDYVGRLKGASSYWLKREFPTLQGFCWQTGYYAVSVSPGQIAAVRNYISNQETHHQRLSTDAELARFQHVLETFAACSRA